MYVCMYMWLVHRSAQGRGVLPVEGRGPAAGHRSLWQLESGEQSGAFTHQVSLIRTLLDPEVSGNWLSTIKSVIQTSVIRTPKYCT